MVLKQIRRPLVGLTAHEAIEIVEAHPRRPLVKRPGGAVLIGGGVVVLAKPRGRIAVALENLTDGRLVRGDDGVIARKAGGHFRDHPEARVLPTVEEVFSDPRSYDLVVVATGNLAHAPQTERALRAGLGAVVDKPLCRLRYQTHQTWQWRNPTTGASLRVSYPSEQVVLIPVTGQ